MQITKDNISSEKARELRFKKGLCSEELYYALKVKGGLNYLGDFPHDNIDLDQVSRAPKPFCMIINTGDQNTQGEHWIALWANDHMIDYIDPYGLPPLQQRTLQLLDRLTHATGHWTCNLEPVQDITDFKSNACGYHCIFILLNRASEPKRELEDLIKCIYNNTQDKDTLVTLLCESTLFND